MSEKDDYVTKTKRGLLRRLFKFSEPEEDVTPDRLATGESEEADLTRDSTTYRRTRQSLGLDLADPTLVKDKE